MVKKILRCLKRGGFDRGMPWFGEQPPMSTYLPSAVYLRYKVEQVMCQKYQCWVEETELETKGHNVSS